LQAISKLTLGSKTPIKLWLIFSPHHKCTPAELARIAGDVLVCGNQRTFIACGTDAYFAELNRDRPPADAAWHSCFSMNPQVHACDEMSIMENIEAQTHVVRSAAAFSKQSVVISPITLRPRFNPNAMEAGAASCMYDPRQSSLFAARWTLGSISLLAQEPNIKSLTYFETFGPGGVMSATGALYPMYHVFAGVAELCILADACVEGDAEGVISVIAGVNQNGQNVLLAANHSDEFQTVNLVAAPDCALLRMRKLVQENVELAANDRSWWTNSPSELREGPRIDLPPCGIVRLQLS
jgi:hypothetical protein